jgi:DUF2075 family protein
LLERAFYSATINDFLSESTNSILAKIVRNNPYDLNDLQRDAWIKEIEILKKNLWGINIGRVILEYNIPRMGKRIDCILLCKGIVFVLEFKVGATVHRKSTDDQVMDYALDLKNFQKSCQDKIIIPISISTEAPPSKGHVLLYEDGVAKPVRINADGLASVINEVSVKYQRNDFDYHEWEHSDYMPTPTIVEAAQALYNNHNVQEITRADAGAKNLTETISAIKEIIQKSKAKHEKSIIFVTGVPGAGKTLVGLNLASEMHNSENEEHAVFLSGNLPLVTVLQEALARDKVMQKHAAGNKINKATALREVVSFIQIIHKYRDEYVGNKRIPTDGVVIFDESQRAWTKDEIASFMARKKGIKNFEHSEPEFLISTVNRRMGWGVIVCLVGGGQEINKGEAGLPEWFDSLKRSFKDWKVYVSDNLKDEEYLRGRSWEEITESINPIIDNRLHLSTSMRSFRSEKVSLFVKQMLDCEVDQAKKTFLEISDSYPICITRDLNTAKKWVVNKSRGNERYGILASSNAARLKPEGIYYAKDRSSIAPEIWFLNGKDDIRSSYFLEVVASEFETQGLELDFAIVGWDADFRMENGKFKCYSMSNRKTPPNWSPIKSENNKRYLKNAYRVLLTRARQGFIIYVPIGDRADATRWPEYYDQTYEYLKSLGLTEII